MSNLVVDAADPRSYHGTQAITRSTLGVPRETGYLGIDTQIEASPLYTAVITVNMDTEEVQSFTLPPSVYSTQWVCIAGADGTGGTVTINLIDAAGATGAAVLTAGAVADAGAWGALTSNIPLQDSAPANRQGLLVTPANGATATGTAIFALEMIVAPSGWR